MKNSIIVTAAVLAALAAVSCTVTMEQAPETDLPAQQEYKTVTITASEGAETKTTYAGDVTLSWTTGDVISVYCTDSTTPANDGFYDFTATSTGASATFTGSIPVTAEIGSVALFPASASHAYDGAKYSFSVDGEKSLLSHDSADIPMYGVNDGAGNISFTHLAGAIKLSVNNIPAGVTQVKVTFTAASSKMSGLFEITGTGPYTWATAAGANSSERSFIRYCSVSDNSFTLYIPYTTGTVWGDNSLLIQDYTGGSVGSTLYSNTTIGAIPVTRKKVTRLGTLSCEYRSAYGVDWSKISAEENTDDDFPAIKSLKATMDADYFYILMEVDKSVMLTTHEYDHYITMYYGNTDGSTGYWTDKYSELKCNVSGENKSTTWWSMHYGVPCFAGLDSNRKIASTVSAMGFYELRFPRNDASAIYAPFAQTSSPVKIGIKMDDLYYPGYSHSSDPAKNYGFIPSKGGSMYEVPQYVAPVLSDVVATASSVSKNYRESITETVNPERGMYRHNEYHFSGGTVNKTSVTCEDDMTLAMLIIYLEDYIANGTLSASTLSSIRTILGNVRSQGKKAIVRFAYNDEHSVKVSSDPDVYEDVNPREPETLSYITGHIDQLEDIFDDYKDIIYLVQAGFLGTYGEWYYTTTTGTPLFPMGWSISGSSVVGFDNRNTVLAEILAKVPNTIQVALRTPFYKRFYLNPTDVDSWSAISSWDGTDANSRLSFHNDAFLAGADDLGTFHYSYPDYTLDKGMWHSQSPKLAVGGEVAFRSLAKCDPAYYALDPALDAIAYYNYSYLNDASGNNEIIQYWVSRDEYPIIRKAIGYRLVLNKLTITPAGTYASGQSVNFSIKVSNTGSASVIYPRPCKLVLLHGSTPTVLKDLTAAHDVRDITPGANYTYTFDVVLPQNICEGDKLAIWMPDKTAGLQSTASYSIRLSNSDVVWENGYNIIHTF